MLAPVRVIIERRCLGYGVGRRTRGKGKEVGNEGFDMMRHVMDGRCMHRACAEYSRRARHGDRGRATSATRPHATVVRCTRVRHRRPVARMVAVEHPGVLARVIGPVSAGLLGPLLVVLHRAGVPPSETGGGHPERKDEAQRTDARCDGAMHATANLLSRRPDPLPPRDRRRVSLVPSLAGTVPPSPAVPTPRRA
jgi:hypothetical protein